MPPALSPRQHVGLPRNGGQVPFKQLLSSELSQVLLPPGPPGGQMERAETEVRPEPMPSRALPEEHGSC